MFSILNLTNQEQDNEISLLVEKPGGYIHNVNWGHHKKKMMRSFLTRQAKSIFYYISEFIILMTVLGMGIFYIYQQRVDQVMFHAARETYSSLKQMEERVDDILGMVVSDLKFLSDLPELKAFAAGQKRSDLQTLSRQILLMVNRQGWYDQLSLVDAQGLERLNIDYGDGGSGEIYVSRFDLSTQDGRIERPYKPLLRLSLPLYNGQGARTGMVTLHLLGRVLLERLQKISQDSLGQFHLLNAQGYWLMAPTADREWGFMLDKNAENFSAHYPLVWAGLAKLNDQGIWWSEDKKVVVSYLELIPPKSLKLISENVFHFSIDGKKTILVDYPWKLLALIDRSDLAAGLDKIGRTYWLIFAVCSVLVILISLIRFRGHRFHEQSRKNLELAYYNLERLVEQRTQALTESNRHLQLHNEDLRRLHRQAQEQKAFLQEIIDSFSHPFFVVDPQDHTILLCNKDALQKSAPSEQASSAGFPLPKQIYVCMGGLDPLGQVQKTGQATVLEYAHTGANGVVEYMEIHAYPLGSLQSGIKQIIVYHVDVSEKRKLLDQFFQAQKMEAVGQLAGGIAHDFNNLLSVMIGYSEQLVEELGADPNYGKRLKDIHRAALKAGDLTRKLLLFSRKHPHNPRLIDINNVIIGILDLIRPIIGTHILVDFKSGSPLRMVMIDRSQFEQVVMNLLVNARDALPNGGKVSISARNVLFKRSFNWQDQSIPAGAYVQVVVSDNGMGMDTHTLLHIFEPFFTTKKEQEGSGLGLSTVYGIIKQHAGIIIVKSQLGRGTTFKIYLPGHGAMEDVTTDHLGEPGKDLGGNEVVLLVDDDRIVREMISTALGKKGYRVMTTGDGQDALRLLRDHPQGIDLVLSDVVMPRMSGVELASLIREMNPHLPVLLMTGYLTDQLQSYRIRNQEWPMIQKPFSFNDLFLEIRRLISESFRNQDRGGKG